MKIKNFRDLIIWKLGKEIVADTYSVTKSYPKEEMFGIVTQMRRSAVSIPSNIAEGFNRFFNKEYRQFLFIALGSCAELETQIEISCDLSYIGHDVKEGLINKLTFESKMVRSLIKKL